MSCASTGFALPVNTAIVDWSTRLSLSGWGGRIRTFV
jgi:hypothetical protein